MTEDFAFFRVSLCLFSDLDVLVIVRVGQKDDDAVRMVGGFDLRAVKFHDLLAGLDLVAFLDEICEAVAVHGHGVNADVDQDFHVAGAGDADGVFGFRNRADGAVIGSVDNALFRINGNALTEDAAGKGLVRDVLLGDDLALGGLDDLAGFALDDGVLRSISRGSCCGAVLAACAGGRCLPARPHARSPW